IASPISAWKTTPWTRWSGQGASFWWIRSGATCRIPAGTMSSTGPSTSWIRAPVIAVRGASGMAKNSSCNPIRSLPAVPGCCATPQKQKSSVRWWAWRCVWFQLSPFLQHHVQQRAHIGQKYLSQVGWRLRRDQQTIELRFPPAPHFSPELALQARDAGAQIPLLLLERHLQDAQEQLLVAVEECLLDRPRRKACY